MKNRYYRFNTRIHYIRCDYDSHEQVVQPDPRTFRPPIDDGPDAVDIREEYGHRGIRVIVKLANIYLTPENPEYEGGTCHVEGQLVSQVPPPNYTFCI